MNIPASWQVRLGLDDRAEGPSVVVKVYAVAGLALGILVYTATLYFQHHLFREQVIETTQTTTRVFARIFANDYWPVVRLTLPPESAREPETMRAWPGIAQIDHIVRSFTRDTGVLKVKLYTLDRLTLYSTDPAQIGEFYKPNHSELSTAIQGRIGGYLEHRSQFSAIDGPRQNVYIVSTYLPIVGDSGAIEGAIEVYFDATAQVASSNRNLILFGALAGLLGLAAYAALFAVIWGAEGGRKRAMDDLRRAKDAAEDASLAKSMFLANMSHELRTPLNAIIGFSEIIQSGAFGAPANAKHAEYIGDIRDSGRYLLALINDLLDLSAIEAGKLELSKTPVAVADVAADALHTIDLTARRGRVTLSADIAPGLPPLAVDPRRLKQMLLNLLSNAIKFTPTGGQVTLHARVDGGHVRLDIVDTGPGMTEAEIAKALTPFSHTDNPMIRRAGGSGLGLPLTRRLIELHGGTLAIASRPGQGTTVTVRLPAA